jgi:hypothetical protein
MTGGHLSIVRGQWLVAIAITIYGAVSLVLAFTLRASSTSRTTQRRRSHSRCFRYPRSNLTPV